MSRLYKLGTCITLKISYISYDMEWNNNLFIHFSNLFNITQFLFEFTLDLE